MKSVTNSTSFMAHLSPNLTLIMSIASSPTRWYTQSNVTYDLPMHTVYLPFRKRTGISLSRSRLTLYHQELLVSLPGRYVCALQNVHKYAAIYLLVT